MYTEKELLSNLEETKLFLNPYFKEMPKIAVVAGSGLGFLGEMLENSMSIPYESIPHFPTSNVEGHKGCLVFGYIEGVYTVVMQGRVHYYEGQDIQKITYPIRLFQFMKIKNLLLTNACGGMHEAFNGGALMVISDHINLLSNSPLMGENMNYFGPRFPDMSEAYDLEYREKMKVIAEKHNITLHEGVYAAWPGPAYETPAEVRYIKSIGADAVGMSTVPEVLVANHGGTRVVAISCITNMAAGLKKVKLNHKEVTEVAERLSDDMLVLVTQFIKNL